MMQNYLSVINSRFDDALFALIAIILIQFIMIAVGLILKKSVSVLPLIEIILRRSIIGMIDRLDRAGRSDFALLMRGTIVFFIILCVLTIIGFALKYGAYYSGLILYTDVMMMVIILSPIGIIPTVYNVSKDATDKGHYQTLSQFLNQNLIALDKAGLRRMSLHALVISLTHFCVAPLFFYIIGGVPIAYAYVAISMLVRIWSKENGMFGRIYKTLDRLLNIVPNILSSIIIAVSSFFSAGTKPLKAFQSGMVNSYKVMAYAQNITLGGAMQNRHGDKISKPWIGPEGASAKLTHKDVIRTSIHYGVALFFVVVLLFVCYAFL